MAITQIIFYSFAALVLLSALFVVTMKDLVRSLFMFFVVLFGLAGLYIFALADFIAVTQVIIYVGGVLVLMLFAFLLSNKELLTNLQAQVKWVTPGSVAGAVIAIVFFLILASAILNADTDHVSWLSASPENHIKPADNTINGIGVSIMTRYLLPFEVVSIFLMMALIGAAHMARKEPKT
jgi:NAD(P)H-quinone oxidoreductase subunit 6